MEITFDKNGYPTDESLEAIIKADATNAKKRVEILDAITNAWNLSYGKVTRKITKKKNSYKFITGGWSGNECLISALQGNVLLWSLTWRCSKYGGYEKFVIPMPSK